MRSSCNWTGHLIHTLLLLSIQHSAICSSNDENLISKSAVPIRRYRRDHDLYDYNNVFLCYLSRTDQPYELKMFCDRSLKCTLKPDQLEETTVELPDLEAMSDNCSEVYNNFKYGADVGKFPLRNGKYIVSQTEIVQLVIERFNVTQWPLDYFCRLDNVTRLTLTHNTVRDSRNFRFFERCGSPGNASCCACNLRHLHLPSNHLQVIGNALFCRFPNLETLDMSQNEITEIGASAFAALANLQTLDVSRNWLKILPVDVFRPLGSVITVDLENNQLNEDVFQALQALPKLRVLDLQQNQIAEIGSETIGDGLPSLIKLRLTRNRLTRLRAVFHAFQNLQILEVGYNEISDISNAVFGPMQQLVAIDLSYNRLRSLPDNMLGENGLVRKLDLTGNQFLSIPKLNSTSLETLVLDRNIIENVTLTDRENLCHLVNLKCLSLASNKMKTVVPHAFDCDSGNLNSLNLKNNSIASVSHIFDESRVAFLNLSENKLNSFSFDDFADGLLELNLDKNEIAGFQSGSDVLDRPMSLRTLQLSDNVLSNLTDVALPPSLEHLDLSTNVIRYFSFAKVTNPSTHLQLVDLRDNQIEVACPLVFHLLYEASRVQILMGQNILLCPCEDSFFRRYDRKYLRRYKYRYPKDCPEGWSANSTLVNDHQVHQKQLFSCDPTEINVKCQCNVHGSYFARCNLPCLESCTCHIGWNFTTYSLNCSERSFGAVPQLLMQPRMSWILDFSRNDLELLNSSAFSSYGTTRELYVKNSKVALITHDTFQNLKALEILDLEGNLLQELPSGLFAGLTKLTKLYLAENRLVHLPDAVFRPLISLRILQLQSNFLSSFPVWSLQDLATLSSVELRNNTWSCDCDYVEHFRSWLQNFSYLVDDAANLFCRMDGETAEQYPLLTFNSSYCYAGLPVYVTGSVTHIWPSLVAVMLFLTVLTVTAFVYRREMQVLIYSRYGLRLFHRNQETEEGKVYDAFIAYSGHDVEFVAHNLVPGLEHIERPYKVCIHERDFLIGAVITDSILEAVELSRRTIVVLSQNFVTSGWCRFEFKSAHLQMLSDRCSRIIVILLDDDLPQDLDPEIQLYLKTNTYLKWGDRLFWKKLYYALPDRKVESAHLPAADIAADTATAV